MKRKINLAIPYSYYEAKFLFNQLIDLDPIESLILILIYSSEEKGNKLKNLKDVIKSDYNIQQEDFLEIFKVFYNNLVNSKTIYFNENDKNIINFNDVLVGEILINKTIKENLNDDFFKKNDGKEIIKNFNYIQNLVIPTGLQNEQKIEKQKNLNDFSDLDFFIKKNKQINNNYLIELDLKAEQIKTKSQSYIENTMNNKTSNDYDIYSNFNNIILIEKEIEYDINMENTSFSVKPIDNITESVFSLYKSDSCFKILESLIINDIFNKSNQIIEKYSINEKKNNDNFTSFTMEEIINMNEMANIYNNIFYYENKIIELNKEEIQIELIIEDIISKRKEQRIFYKELDLEILIEEIIDDDEKIKLLFDICNQEQIKIIINKIISKFEYINKYYYLIDKKLLNDFYKNIIEKYKIQEIITGMIFNSKLENILIEIILIDFEKSDFNNDFFNGLDIPDEKFIKKIMLNEKFRINYNINKYKSFFKKSIYEREILDFYKKYNELNINEPKLNQLEDFKNKLTFYINEKKDFKWFFDSLNADLELKIKVLKKSKENDFKDEIFAKAVDARTKFENLLPSKEYSQKQIIEAIDLKIKKEGNKKFEINKIKSIKDELNDIIHYNDNKNKINFNKEKLESLIKIKQYIDELEEWFNK